MARSGEMMCICYGVWGETEHEEARRGTEKQRENVGERVGEWRGRVRWRESVGEVLSSAKINLGIIELRSSRSSCNLRWVTVPSPVSVFV